jgi:hypothetical protein
MKSNISSSVLTVTLSLMFTAAAQSVEISKKAFQSEYENTASSGIKTTSRMSSDGKGHGRTESISGNRRTISIMDYGARKIFILNPELKTVMTMPFRDDDMEGMAAAGKKISATARPLGVKLIDGHMCTGKHYDLDGGGSEDIWTGNDIDGTRVYSKVTMPKFGVSESHLKSYSAVAPPADAFTIPAGYKQQETFAMPPALKK